MARDFLSRCIIIYIYIYIYISIIDGKSSDADALKDAVKEISDESFTIFSVGVSGADIEELKLYSSDPDCLHVYLLNDFTDMTDFVGQIQSLTCKGRVHLNRSSQWFNLVEW